MPLRFSSSKGDLAGNEVGMPLLLCWVNPTGTRFCRICIARKGQRRGNLALNGVRCKNKTCFISNFCLVHLKTIMNLEIKDSEVLRELGIQGKGLFAYCPTYGSDPIFDAKRNHIAYYGGKVLSNVELDNIYDYYSQDADRSEPPDIEPTAPYGGYISARQKIDAACRRKAAAYANSPYGIV